MIPWGAAVHRNAYQDRYGRVIHVETPSHGGSPASTNLHQLHVSKKMTRRLCTPPTPPASTGITPFTERLCPTDRGTQQIPSAYLAHRSRSRGESLDTPSAVPPAAASATGSPLRLTPRTVRPDARRHRLGVHDRRPLTGYRRGPPLAGHGPATTGVGRDRRRCCPIRPRTSLGAHIHEQGPGTAP